MVILKFEDGRRIAVEPRLISSIIESSEGADEQKVEYVQIFFVTGQQLSIRDPQHNIMDFILSQLEDYRGDDEKTLVIS